MERYQAAFRLHGPTKIDSRYKFGGGTHDDIDITIRPEKSIDGISGIIEFEFEAENLTQAKEIADTDLERRARIITGVVSFTFEEGITVGSRYKVTTADAAYKERTDTRLEAGEYVLSIADQVYANISESIDQEENLRRALNWYSYGLSTKAADDRLVAFWTGIEAFVEKKTENIELSTSQRDAIKEAKDHVMDQFDGSSDVGRWVGGHFGNLLSGSNMEDDDEAVLRVAKEQVDESQFSVDLETVVETVYNARNAIVHQGIQVESVSSKANLAEKLLRELLMSSLPGAFANFITDEEPDRIGSPRVYYDTALPLVFENSYDLELDRLEIKKRLFALHRDLTEAYRFQVRAFAGETDDPLVEVEEGVFQLNPDYDFERETGQ